MSARFTQSKSSVGLTAGMLVLSLAAFSQPALAVPSFARQTGLACEACHTVFPQLTPFGRVFKASGYTLFNTRKVQDIDEQKRNTLSLSDLPPVSLMVLGSSSFATKANDVKSSKTSTDFPQQVSLFYAGHITDNLGAFIQITYSDQSGSFGMDNTDIRFADVATVSGHNLIYGVSLNNNPTVQDLWNSTPAWGEPFVGSPAQQAPAGGSQIEGAMAGSVAGLSAYGYLDNALYAEVGVYRSALQGASVANNGDTNNKIIEGVAPYWRIAYEQDWGNNSWEIGALGEYAALQNPMTPAGAAINGPLQHAPTDRFLDAGIDSQYQYIDDENQITVASRWIHENQKLDASYAATNSTNRSNKLDTFNLTASYFRYRKIGGSLGFFSVSSSNDAVYFGTAQGSTNSNWGTAEVDYVPWQNIKLGLKYTAFMKFDGATSNYDGAGRKASDNNMLYGFLWVAF